MAVWANHQDHDAAALARAAQADPWRMWLILRYKSALWSDLMPALAAQACLKLLHDPGLTDEQRHAVDVWKRVSFGKVTLRANEGQWQRLLAEVPGVAVAPAHGTDLIYATVPAPRSQRPALLGKLQSLGARDTGPEPDMYPPVHPAAAVYAVKQSLHMSLGKTMAQVAHAAMILLESPLAHEQTARFFDWRDAGWPGRTIWVTDARFEQLKRSHDCVAVRDGGLTEVEPGTETVLAFAPGTAI